MTSLAQLLIDLLRVNSDAENAQPGKLVHIDVLPGFSAPLPTSTPNPLNINNTLNTLVLPIDLFVKYDLKKKDGSSVSPVATTDFVATDFTSTPPTPIQLNVDTKLLNVAFLLKPPVGEDTVATEPFHYEIDVTLTISSPEIGSASKTVTIPIDMPALQIPSLLLLGGLANFNVYGQGDDHDDKGTPGSLFVMVRESTSLRDIGAIVATLNRLIGLIQALESVLHFGAEFIGVLADAATFIGNTPTVYFNIGNCPAFDDGDKGLSFEHDATSLLLIGVRDHSKTVPDPVGGNVPTVPGVTQVTLYSQNDFSLTSLDPIHEADHTTFSVNEIVGHTDPGKADDLIISTGVGYLKISNFTNPRLGYATEDGNDMDNDTQSARWGGVDVT